MVLQDYNCDDSRSRRGSETQLHRGEYDAVSVSLFSNNQQLKCTKAKILKNIIPNFILTLTGTWYLKLFIPITIASPE